ncbi:hypothetical protein MMC27_003464 [Xylographa pallens]|nr:hypothetical protein [Xylographa pallens]
MHLDRLIFKLLNISPVDCIGHLMGDENIKLKCKILGSLQRGRDITRLRADHEKIILTIPAAVLDGRNYHAHARNFIVQLLQLVRRIFERYNFAETFGSRATSTNQGDD